MGSAGGRYHGAVTRNPKRKALLLSLSWLHGPGLGRRVPGGGDGGDGRSRLAGETKEEMRETRRAGAVFVHSTQPKTVMKSDKNKTLVIGASEKPDRYSNKLVRLLQQMDIPHLALGYKEGKIGSTQILTNLTEDEQASIDTISLYLNPKRQEEYYSLILQINPDRIIYNPGTENPTLMDLAKNHNINNEIACSLVLLRTGQWK